MENMVFMTFKLKSLQNYSLCWNIGTMFTSKISVVVGMRISEFHAC